MRKILYILLLLPFVVKSQTRPLQPVQMPQATMYYDLATKHRWMFNGLTYQYFDFGQYQSYNQVLSGLNLSVVGSTLTVSTGSWNISNTVYTLSSPANFTLQSRDTIYSRYETVYADSVNNGIHIAVGTLSPNPVEPSIPHGDLRVGAVLITPTGTIVVPPGPVNQFVLSSPLTQQNATPWTRTYRTDTLTIAGKYIFPSVDGTSAQVLQTDGSGHLYWSSQAIYTPGFGLNLNAQAFSVDTSKIVTLTAMLDTLHNNAAHFDTTQFSVVNDTIHCTACGGSGGSDSTLYKADGTIKDPIRTVNLDTSLLKIVGQKGDLQIEVDHEYDYWNASVTDTAKKINSNINESTEQAGISAGSWKNGFRNANIVADITCCDVFGKRSPLAYMNVTDSSGRQKQIYMLNYDGNDNGQQGIRITDTRDTIGILMVDTSYNKNGRRYDSWLPTWSAVKSRVDSAVLAHGSPTGANPTATATTSAVNGSATTFMRSDAAPKVDSSVFRTTANSLTLAQTQTALNAKQATLVSGTNIKTINSVSLLGSGNIVISGSTQVYSEIPTGTINGSNTSFTIAHTPLAGISLFLNGLMAIPTTDYSVSGTTITMVTAPVSGDNLMINYSY